MVTSEHTLIHVPSFWLRMNHRNIVCRRNRTVVNLLYRYQKVFIVVVPFDSIVSDITTIMSLTLRSLTSSSSAAAFTALRHRRYSTTTQLLRRSGGSSSSYTTKYSRQRHNAGNRVGFHLIGGIAIAAGMASAAAMAYCDPAVVVDDDVVDKTTTTKNNTNKNKKMTLRTESFPIESHSHGKTRVRVMKVVKNDSNDDGDDGNNQHDIHEYNVTITLLSDEYEKCFINGDNTDLVATDTQKNTVYVIAKRCSFNSPEGFGVLLCHHFLKEYPMLRGVQVKVDQVIWDRAVVDGVPHNHGFVKSGPETYTANVEWHRPTTLDSNGNNVDDDVGPKITSHINQMTVLKTTQSGFEGYLKDQYTLLPETKERCLATELDATWTCSTGDYSIDHAAIRNKVRPLIQKAIFGPSADNGIYSPSLQATIYDAACLVLKEVPEIESITIYTPNLHYLPCKLLDRVGETFEDDIFIPTDAPSGIITCTVVRDDDNNDDEKANKAN